MIADDSSPIAQARAETALSLLNNGVKDSRPIMVLAGLTVAGPGEACLPIGCFDEDEDLRGLCIEEHHLDPNGTTRIIRERYPVYAGTLYSPLYLVLAYDVEIRDEGQRKDEGAWRDYMILALDRVVGWVADGLSETVTETNAGNEELETPPIWVSIPEPNRVRVYVSAYDRADHESEPFELSAPGPLVLDALTELGERDETKQQ